MSDYAVVKLDEIPKRDKWIPVRDHFGIGAFGTNAYRAEAAGDSVIGEHTELMAKHEELYVVVEGHAAFTVGGEEIDAPQGTLVFVADPETRRGAVAREAGTTVLVVGGRPGHAFEVSPWEESWEENQQAMALYREQRYADAADVLREAERGPGSWMCSCSSSPVSSRAGRSSMPPATRSKATSSSSSRPRASPCSAGETWGP